MSRWQRACSLALVVFALTPLVACGTEDDLLTDSELTDLLYEVNREHGETDFLVLPEDYEEPVTGVEGTYSLLLIGVDTDGQGLSGRSDTMVLAVLNTRNRSVKLVSFMRDLFVHIPGRGNNRLNAAHVYGGPDLLVRTLETEFKVKVDGYLAVDFGLMARLVDAIGGIEMTVSEEEFVSLNHILAFYNQQHGRPKEEGRLGRAGVVRLSGLQALSYARIRKMDSDFERVGRQQEVLKAIFRQMLTLDSRTLGELIARFVPEIKTNVSLLDALDLVSLLAAGSDLSLQALTIPVKGGSRSVIRNKAAILLPNMKKNISAIADFLNQ